MILNPQHLSTPERYKIATGSILPRPIAWVSTRDALGRPNLAPFSYFTIAATDPLTLIVCPQLRAGRPKDTLANIREVGEFVINIAGEDLVGPMNASSAELPPHISEFDYAHVTPAPSEVVSAPRVAEAPIAFECTLNQIVTIGNGAAVFGTVQMIHVRDDLYDRGRIAVEQLRPLGRLAGNFYTRVTDTFELARG